MASANVSYINTYPTIDWSRVRRSVYPWSIAGLGLLDIVLLFGLLNPFVAQPAARYRLVANQTQADVVNGGAAVADKPSPLGSVVAPSRGRRTAELVK